MTEQAKKTPSTPKVIKDTESQEVKKIVKKLKGIVVSDKMDKTIVVRVDRRLLHPKYHKSYVSSKKYKVHDEKNQYKVGDEVTFINSRAFSKDKKWRVL